MAGAGSLLELVGARGPSGRLKMAVATDDTELEIMPGSLELRLLDRAVESAGTDFTLILVIAATERLGI